MDDKQPQIALEGGGRSQIAFEDDRQSQIALTIAYRGAAFRGFARQPGQETIQGALEQALATLYHREVQTVGAGRTDRGVHAHGQVVSFGLCTEEIAEHSLGRLRSALNALTPDDIVIRFVDLKPPGFSARFSASEREYRYRIYTKSTPPLFLAPYVWWLPREHPLDIQAMKAAAELLVGEHDFTSFCVATSSRDKNTVREIRSLLVFGADHLGESCHVVQVIGNAFLHSMIRIIVGSLAEVGMRRHPPEWIGEVLEARDRTCAGQTAPAQGLTFWRVRY
ncbi:MAG: tRNA pseudouridine(38-40) synthase TruA [Coriobacteriales bacterium]|jgi:tRNA pseudouridine38-40 synthase|nr:tRNA pseudouridine(38-40) synthase TruA [Coriobacteriales bacterium]